MGWEISFWIGFGVRFAQKLQENYKALRAGNIFLPFFFLPFLTLAAFQTKQKPQGKPLTCCPAEIHSGCEVGFTTKVW